MARVNNLNDFLTDVASAIKTKKGSETAIPAANFDTEILALPSQGTYEQRVLNISKNGTQTITPSAGFDAIDELELTVAVPEKQLQSKTYNFTQNTTIQLLPDTGYDGFDVVTLNIEVPGEEINNQDKTITTNGTYTADEGYTGLGTVTVNVPQTGDVPVKLFETQEEMQADTTAKEGDLAIVYRSEIQNATVDSKFQTATFPDTVVLDTAITDYVEVRYRAVDSSKMFDCWGELGSSGFSMNCYSETGEVRIEYRSSDGITYTRTDTTGNPVDFGTEIYYEMAEMWNDAIGKFIQVGGNTFEGLYQYSEITPDDIKIIKTVDGTDSKAISFSNVNKFIKNNINTSYSVGRYNTILLVKSIKLIDEKWNIYEPVKYNLLCGIGNQTCYPMIDNSDRCLYTTNAVQNVNIKKYVVENDSLISTTEYTVSSSSSQKICYNQNYQKYLLDDDIQITDYIYSGDAKYTVKIDVDFPMSNATVNGTNIDNSISTFKYFKYIIAPTQFTLSNSNELLPNKIAYGKTGVIIGDKTIYDNLDYDTLYEQLGLTIYNDIELINSTFERGKLYSLTPTNEEDENTMYYRPVKRIINSSKVLNDEICSATGTTDTYRTSSNSLRCSNYNCNLYIGTTNKNVYFVVYDDDNNIINCNSIFTTNQSTYGIYSRVVVDENYYYYDTQYGTDNVIIKVNREDGTCVIKHFSVPVSVNTFLSESACTFTELNNNLVYVDANSDGKGNVLYVDKNLNVIKNISYTYPDAWASEYPSTAVVMNNCLYWTIRCNLNRLFKFDGNSVIYGNEIGTGTGIAGINYMFTDGQYIYTGWYGAAGIYKLDKDCRVVATLDSSYDIPLYNNLYNYDFEITDYRNYSCKDAYGHKRIVKDGALQRNYVNVTGLTFITNGNLLNDLRLGNTLTGKNVIAKIQKGTHTNSYNNIVTKNTNNHIYVTSLYEETISPVEYNTAIDTADEILGEEV